MSHESDSFIDEVTEEVRRDRLFGLFRRYGWIGIVGILAIVAGAAWREYDTARRTAEAEAWGDAVIAAQTAEDPVAALSALDGGGNPDRAALGDMLAAGAAGQAGNAAQQVALLDQAHDSAADPALRDAARLKAVIAAGDSMDPAARDAALTELSKPGAPFRMLALEQKAVALIAADRRDDAITLLREIQVQDGVTQQLARRLSELLITLGAGADPSGAATSTTTQLSPSQ